MLAAETIGTFIVMLVILETACNKKANAGNMAPMVIGLAFVIVIIAIAPISGASLNPARSLGPALLSGYFSHLWIYLIAPCVGSFLAAPVHLFFVSDLDTVQSRAQRALEEGSVEPLLPNTAGGTQ
jgi:glycerol uptake facilitator-like aquaporin